MADEPRDPKEGAGAQDKAIGAAEKLKKIKEDVTKGTKDNTKAEEDNTKAVKDNTKAVEDNVKAKEEAVKATKEAADATKAEAAEAEQAAAKKKTYSEEEQELRRQNRLAYEIERTIRLRHLNEESEYSKKSREDRKREKDAIEDMADAWTKILNAVDKYQKKLAETSPHGAAAMSNVSRALTGAKDMSGAIGSIGGAISSLAGTAGGVGGLLGMLFYGLSKEAEFQAIGATAAQQFDKIGDKSAGLGGRMAALGKGLTLAGVAAKEDLASVAASFTDLGVSASGAEEKVEGFSSKFGSSLMIASLFADKGLELPAGTMAKLSGTMSRDFNTSAKEAFVSLTNIGLAAKDAGLNTVTFMQQSMEAASALRLLNANAESVMMTQLAMVKAMKEAGFVKIDPITHKATASTFGQEYAARGTASLANSIAGMDIGFAGIIGKAVYQTKDEIEGWYAMKSPLGRGGAEQMDMPKIMQEMAKIFNFSKETTDAQKAIAYVQSGLVKDIAGADVLIRAQKSETYLRTGKFDKETADKLNAAGMSESEKTSSIVLALGQIKQAIADTVVSLLKLVIDGLKLMYEGFMWLGNKFMAAVTFSGVSKSYSDEAEAWGKRSGRTLGSMNKEGATVWQGANTIIENVRGLGKGILNDRYNDPVAEAEEDKVIAAARARRRMLRVDDRGKPLPGGSSWLPHSGVHEGESLRGDPLFDKVRDWVHGKDSKPAPVKGSEGASLDQVIDGERFSFKISVERKSSSNNINNFDGGFTNANS